MSAVHLSWLHRSTETRIRDERAFVRGIVANIDNDAAHRFKWRCRPSQPRARCVVHHDHGIAIDAHRWLTGISMVYLD